MIEAEFHKPGIDEAITTFSPDKYGFTPQGSGWVKKFKNLGNVVIAPIGRENPQALRSIDTLQRKIWGDKGFVSPGKLSNAEDTGGALFAAYSTEGIDQKLYGFLYGVGGKEKYSSEMLGIANEARDANLGWYMKLIQAHNALKNGFTEVHWTYDPLRGTNAILNLQKLAGEIDIYYLDRYGIWDSQFNGDLPTPRFGVTLDLTSETVHKRLGEVFQRKYEKPSLDFVRNIPSVNGMNAHIVADSKIPLVKYEIPEDITTLPANERATKLADSQLVFGTLLTTEIPFEDTAHPEYSKRTIKRGTYHVKNVITGFMPDPITDESIRHTYYLLENR